MDRPKYAQLIDAYCGAKFRTAALRNVKAVFWIDAAVLTANTLVRILVYAFGNGLSDNGLDILFTMVVQTLCMGLLPVSLYVVFVAGGARIPDRLCDTADAFGYHVRLRGRTYAMAIVAGLLLFYANYGASYATVLLLTLSGYTFTDTVPTMMPTIGDLILWIFMTGVMPAIFEELTHRGLILSALLPISRRYAVVLSALMFALMHQNVVQVFYAFIAGLIMGSIVVYTRSIIPAMIIHFLNNALSVILQYSSQHDGAFARVYMGMFEDVHAGTLILLIASWALAYFMISRLLRYIKKDSATTAFVDFRRTTCEPAPREMLTVIDKYRLRRTLVWENKGALIAIALGVITTLFSFVWGKLR